MASIQLSDVQQAQLKEIFDLFDTDGGGSIDSLEKDAAMYALGFKPLTSQIRQASQMGASQIGSQGASLSGLGSSPADLAENSSQTITLIEFTTLMKGEHVMRDPVEAIWAAFAELSGVGDSLGSDPGVVTVEALRRACDKYDVRLSEDELYQLINDLDTDGDGSVDKAEYMRLMRHAPWF
jgi:Ca2+-binding EF-hand superfamily protein